MARDERIRAKDVAIAAAARIEAVPDPWNGIGRAA
jgi:hypothetical protein